MQHQPTTGPVDLPVTMT